jgi:hypothetical protein
VNTLHLSLATTAGVSDAVNYPEELRQKRLAPTRWMVATSGARSKQQVHRQKRVSCAMSLNGDDVGSPESADDVDGRDALGEEEAADLATVCEDPWSDVPADDDFADQVRNYD